MEIQDPALEWNRLAEQYRQKSDDELEIIAGDAYDLTEIAQQVLTAEISERKLPIKLNLDAPPPEDEEEPLGPVSAIDPDELDLQSVRTVESREEAADIKQLLDDAGIASFIGDDNVQELENFHGRFEGGVEIKVRYVDLNRASAGLQHLRPSPGSEIPDDEIKEELPSCPACHSQEIVFLSHDPADKEKFRWRCDACGHKWTDDGVVK